VKTRTRESELKAAIIKANLPPRDFKVYMVLMDRAQWGTAKIADKFQPRSLQELARRGNMSEANVKRSLNHLQRHGWVKRYRHLTGKGIGGRGHPTRYQLEHGRDCDCRNEKGAQHELVSGEKGAQDCTIKGLKSEDIAAGQARVSAKSVREEGEGERAALCEICSQPLDSYLASLGDTSHPTCDPAYSQRPPIGFQWPEGSYGAEANK
jgi:predicted transcriptional regulator